ncbi:MAG: tail fiber domain-containing protein [Saprospiraceae bacterium]|nr:tail fiber domain-containing protein [Saprospiraceae bacterium]
MKNLTFSLCFIFIINVVIAQVPRTISYQGVLTDAQGNLIPDGNRTLVLKLYDNLFSTNPIYTESQTVPIVKGIFNAIIGSVSPIPSSLNFDRAYFLGVSLDFGQEMSPRTALTAAPYALRSERANVAETLAPGASGVVTSVNSAQGNIALVGSGGTTVNQQGSTITISSSPGGPGGTITGIQNTDGILNLSNPNGPSVGINLNTVNVNEGSGIVFSNGAWGIKNKPFRDYVFDVNLFDELNNSLPSSKTAVTLKFLGSSNINDGKVLKWRDGRWQFLQPFKVITGAGLNAFTTNIDEITISAKDESPTNELQGLTYNTATKQLSISQGNSQPNSVELSGFIGGTAPRNNIPMMISPSAITASIMNQPNFGFIQIDGSLNVSGDIAGINRLVLQNGSRIFNCNVANDGKMEFHARGDDSFKSIVIDDDNDQSVMINTNISQTGFQFLVKGKAKFIDGAFFGTTEGFSLNSPGSLKMSNSLLPDATKIRDLGSISRRFNDVFANRINIGNDLILSQPVADGPAIINHSFHPSGNDFINLGSNSARWKTIYSINPLDRGSDIRLKDKIRSITYGLNEVLRLNPVSYVLKSDSENHICLGLLAQEVQMIIPSIVHGNIEKEMLSITYEELIPVLINAIKEQQKQIDELKAAKVFGDQFTSSEILQIKAMLSQETVQK